MTDDKHPVEPLRHLLVDAASFLERVADDTGYVGARAWAVALRDAERECPDAGLREWLDNDLRSFVANVETGAEDNGTPAVLIEDLWALARDWMRDRALAASTEPTLDAAWAEVEAALPLSGWPDGEGRWALPASDREIRLRWRESGDGYSEPHYEGWEATGIVYGFGAPNFQQTSDLADTPAEALRALAARLASQVREQE